MISKLPILFFFSTFLSIINCGCPSGYFTKNNPCDTKAALIKSSKYTAVDIPKGKWYYFYLPLSGLGDTFGLSLRAEGLPLDAYINFQQADQYKLPTDGYYDYGFYAGDGDRTIPLAVLTYGMKNRNAGKMLLGIYNPSTFTKTLKIQYYTIDQDTQSAFNKLVITIVITVLTAFFAFLCLAVIVKRTLQRRREIIRRQNLRLQFEAQGLLINLAQGDQNNVKSSDALTLEEFQKYFPKKSFGELKNHYQQTGCSVCLEDFSTETLCYQFYCNHIFHEACIQIWLEKKNSCPSCRVPLGKKAIEEFLEAQKKQTEVNVPENIEIKIQDEQDMDSEQENKNQTQT